MLLLGLCLPLPGGFIREDHGRGRLESLQAASTYIPLLYETACLWFKAWEQQLL